MAKPPVGIIMGSSSDSRIMNGAAEVLESFGVGHEDQIVSAHRTPERLGQYAEHAENSGIAVIIAGAGGAAHLPGMIASHTTIPVIGVPIMVYNDKSRSDASAFGGMDALLSISEMPTGSPVACVGVNKAANAALYALRILAVSDHALGAKLKEHKKSMFESVLKESRELEGAGLPEFAGRKFRSQA